MMVTPSHVVLRLTVPGHAPGGALTMAAAGIRGCVGMDGAVTPAEPLSAHGHTEM